MIICDDRGVRHLYRCPLRWADLDLLGHVNNVTYVDYLQEARVDMMRSHGPAVRRGEDGRDGEDLAEGVVVVRHEVEFLAPLRSGDFVEGRARVVGRGGGHLLGAAQPQ